MLATPPKLLDLYDLTEAQLQELVVALGERPYRARQIWHNLYRKLVTSIDQMNELPVALRQQLAQRAGIGLLQPQQEVASADKSTLKVRASLADEAAIETVVMEYLSGRNTICVSTQVGCAVGCPFCATGEMGFSRNLTAGEIVAQVLHFARQRPLDNLVFMGMGEPFLNYDNMWRAVTILNSPHGLGMGARRFTISTSGIIPGIQRLAGESILVNLALSLHAPNDELRQKLVPISKKYPLHDLMAACDDYTERTGRRISYEYVLLAGVNDSDELAHQLGRLLEGKLAHVNLIPVNPPVRRPEACGEVLRAESSTRGQTADKFERPSRNRQLNFQDIIHHYGIRATIRAEKGVEISAACGQLAAPLQTKLDRPPIPVTPL